MADSQTARAKERIEEGAEQVKGNGGSDGRGCPDTRCVRESYAEIAWEPTPPVPCPRTFLRRGGVSFDPRILLLRSVDRLARDWRAVARLQGFCESVR